MKKPHLIRYRYKNGVYHERKTTFKPTIADCIRGKPSVYASNGKPVTCECEVLEMGPYGDLIPVGKHTI